MIRVLRILNRFNLGGPIYNATFLSRYLPDEFETLLIGGENYPSEKNSEYIPISMGIKPRIIKGMSREVNPLNDIVAFREILHIIKEFRPHIVHTHAAKAGALGRVAAFAQKVPIILHTFHGHVFDGYFSKTRANVYKNIERGLAGISTGIIAISDAQQHDLAVKHKICPIEKVRVIPLGFDLEHFGINREENRNQFRAHYKINPDEIAIGIIGRLVPIKNHVLFLKAIKQVQELTTRRVRAFVIGDGECRVHLLQTAQSLGLDYTVWPENQRVAPLTFTGWITDMAMVMAGMDIVALSSLNEGTPLSLIEAQAAGKPIVSTKVGGIENVVEKDKTAFLAESFHENEFSRLLAILVNDDALREQMGNAGLQTICKKYHYQNLANNTAGYYKELLASKQVAL